MKCNFLVMALGGLMAACSASAADDSYTLVAGVPESLNGATAFLVNFDSGAKIDSVTVQNGTATFRGEAINNYPVRIIVNGRPLAQGFVDGGDITVNNGSFSGSALNDASNALSARVNVMMKAYEALPADSVGNVRRKEIEQQYNEFTDSVFLANTSNALGYTLFLDKAYGMTVDELRTALAKYPAFKESQRISKLLVAAENKASTQPGNKFKDFTVVNDSVAYSLSDYVGKGKPVLVDFWASWCGPCMRQARVLKEIYAEYEPKGLEVLGVAVWDEPANTLEAIKKHALPWPNIINAQTIPTDIYGISGIPCIILFGPDGTILSRDKQGDELKADVKAYFDGTLFSESTAQEAR